MDTASNLLGKLGLGGVFLGSIIESLGVPFPGGVMLVLAGVLVDKGSISYIWAFIMAVSGFNIGATAAFFIGRKFGEQFFSKFGKLLKINDHKLMTARSWMEKSAAAFIILGRFLPMASNLTPYLAGMSGLGIARFFLYNNIYAFIWSSLFLALGYFFARSWQRVFGYLETTLPYITGAILVVYILVLLLMRKKIK